jgi:hypothetical protein
MVVGHNLFGTASVAAAIEVKKLATKIGTKREPLKFMAVLPKVVRAKFTWSVKDF